MDNLEKLPGNEHILDAYNISLMAQKNSYSPYSKFPVGSAVKFINHDQIFYGTNIENLSYGATICAERSAIAQGIATLEKQIIEFVIVVAPGAQVISPCGICLQVISEFSSNETLIYLATKKGVHGKYNYKDFLTIPFETDLLKRP